MRKIAISCSVLGATFALVLSATTAVQAQATRTWVSGVGDDVNPCSRTAPCKTFPGAISKTAAGGIINCIDPGGFGAVTITKSITIDCSNTMAGVLAAGTNGININTGLTTDIVRLVGLDIEGIGTGLVGVNVTQVGTLHIERCNIYGFRSGTAVGVNFNTPTGVTSELFITNSVIEDNGSSTTNGGVSVQAAGTGTSRTVISNTKIANNSAGVRVVGNGSTGGLRAVVSNSVIGGNTNDGIIALSAGATTTLFLDKNVVFANGTGVHADGAAAFVQINGNTITGQIGAGLSATASGAIASYVNNAVNFNSGGDGAATTTLTPFK